MRAPPLTSRVLRLLARAAVAAGVGACDHPVRIVDGFGDAAVEGDRLHTYATGGRVDLLLTGEGLRPDFDVVSSDEDVFRVDSVESQVVPGFFGPETTALTVVVKGAAAGAAELIVRNAVGDEVATRTLTFVDVDGVVFTRALGLPGDVEPPVDPAALAIGERGADFFVRFVAGDDDHVHGRAVIEFADRQLASVEVSKNIGFTTLTSRNYVHIQPVTAPTRLAFSLAGSKEEHTLALFPGAADEIRFVRRDELRARLQDGDVDAEVARLLDEGGDERLLCRSDRCVAKVEAEDAEGRVIFGAAVHWHLPGEEQPLSGDLFSFEPGDEEVTVRAVLGDFEETLTVRAAPDTLAVASSTEVTSCASSGPGEGGLVLCGLVALRRRRRRQAATARGEPR
jgi:hypothetical protein